MIVRRAAAAALLSSLIAISLGAQDPATERDLRVRIRTTSGDNLVGKSRLGTIVVKTEHGDARVRPEQLGSYGSAPPPGLLSLVGGHSLRTAWPTPSIELETDSGKLTVKLEMVQGMVFELPAGAPPAPGPAAPAKPGRAYRTYRDSGGRTWEEAFATPDGKHIVTLDRAGKEVIFVPLDGGEPLRVATENAPSAMVLRGDRLYVANRLSRSVTIVDARTRAAAGRIELGDEPAALAAPASAAVLYVGAKDSLRVVDLDKGRDLGPMTFARSKEPLKGTFHALAVSADNQLLYWHGAPLGESDALRLFRIEGRTLSYVAGAALAVPGPITVDVLAGRVYATGYVNALSLRSPLGEPGASALYPHPDRGLVFGRATRGASIQTPTTFLRAWDAASLQRLGERDLQEHIVAVVPLGDVVHVLTLTRAHSIPIADLVGAAAAAPPLRRPAGDDFDKAVADGAKVLRDGNARGALKAVQPALAVVPPKAESLIALLDVLAGAALALGAPDDAILRCREGLKADPRSTVMWVRLAAAYEAGRNLGAALSSCRAALKVDSAHAVAKRESARVAALLREDTKTICFDCDGRGKFEGTSQTGGASKNVTVKCTRCQGAGFVWTPPCAPCLGGGHVDGRDCGACGGSGRTVEPYRK